MGTDDVTRFFEQVGSDEALGTAYRSSVGAAIEDAIDALRTKLCGNMER